MTQPPSSQIALVTGASRGIGAAIATELARQGFFVIGTATTESGAAAIGQSLSAAGRGQGVALCPDGVVVRMRGHAQIVAVHMRACRDVFGRLPDDLAIAQHVLAPRDVPRRDLVPARHRPRQGHPLDLRALAQIGQRDHHIVRAVQPDHARFRHSSPSQPFLDRSAAHA